MVFSYAIGQENHGRGTIPLHLAYHASKLFSYVAVGAILGFVGSAIVLSSGFRGIAAFIAGIFTILFGVNMLDIFPAFRALTIRPPSFLLKAFNSAPESSLGKPVALGLLTGLMPCGPLIAMQLYAIGTGTALEGAFALLVFGLGTTPLMFFVGVATSFANSRLKHKLFKVSALIVIALGVLMLDRGLVLVGSHYMLNSAIDQASVALGLKRASHSTQVAPTVGAAPVQEISLTVSNFRYSPKVLMVAKGVDTVWRIFVKDFNPCTEEILVPVLEIRRKLAAGENVIKFTPIKEGIYSFTCGHGMLRGTLVVTSQLIAPQNSSAQDSAQENHSVREGNSNERRIVNSQQNSTPAAASQQSPVTCPCCAGRLQSS